tara:strand:+ start:1292 stop:1543 length:252 start_codon:yes stop_codon:yes gene_type:complete
MSGINDMIDAVANKGSIAKLMIEIEEELKYVDIRPYSHNIVGLKLQQLHNISLVNFKLIIYMNKKQLNKKGWRHLVDEYCEEN